MDGLLIIINNNKIWLTDRLVACHDGYGVFTPVGSIDEYDRVFFWIILKWCKKMLKVLIPVSIGLLNDSRTIFFEMDPPGVRDDQDPS